MTTATATHSNISLPRWLRRMFRLLFLGYVALTATEATRSECQDVDILLAAENRVLITAEDGTAILAARERRCELVIGHFRFPLPARSIPLG